MRARRALVVGLGAAAVAVYLAATVSGTGPQRPLYETNFLPEPYRWANPPEVFKQGNKSPLSAHHEVELTASGSVASSMSTGDGQAALVVKPGSFAAKKGETKVIVDLDPADPATFGASPSGLSYDGNAYRFRAVYSVSKAEAPLTQPATVVFRYPIFATKILHRENNAWTQLTTSPVAASLTVFADTPSLGDFVPAGPVSGAPKPKSRTLLIVGLALGAAVLGAVVGLLARRRAAQNRRKRRPVPKGGAVAKGAPPKGGVSKAKRKR
jgi:hypothetical protein